MKSLQRHVDGLRRGVLVDVLEHLERRVHGRSLL